MGQVERDYLKAFSEIPRHLFRITRSNGIPVSRKILSPNTCLSLRKDVCSPEDFLNYADDSIRQFEEEQ